MKLNKYLISASTIIVFALLCLSLFAIDPINFSLYSGKVNVKINVGGHSVIFSDQLNKINKECIIEESKKVYTFKFNGNAFSFIETQEEDHDIETKISLDNEKYHVTSTVNRPLLSGILLSDAEKENFDNSMKLATETIFDRVTNSCS